MAEQYQLIDDQVLDVIKYPPLLTPTVSYYDDQEEDINNLYDNLYQFCYNYIYDDFEKSVYSPHSKIPIPQYNETVNGLTIRDDSTNNTILVKLETGHHTVSKIQVAVKKNKLDFHLCDVKEKFTDITISGQVTLNSYWITNIGDYGGNDIDDIQEGMLFDSSTIQTLFGTTEDVLIVEVDKKNNKVRLNFKATNTLPINSILIDNDYIYSVFKDSRNYGVVTDKEAYLLYHNVPKLAETQQLVKDIGNGIRLIYGNILDGYDNIDVDLKPEVDYLQASDFSTLKTLDNSLIDVTSGSRFYIAVLPSDLGNNDSVELSTLWSDGTSNVFRNVKKLREISEVIEDLADDIDDLGYGGVANKLESHPSYQGDYSLSSYDIFDVVKYNNNLYKSKASGILSSPSGDNSSNSLWYYISPYSSIDRIFYFVQAVLIATTEITSIVISIFDSKKIYKTFKDKSYYQVAIEYLDKQGRVFAAMTNEQAQFYIPPKHEQEYDLTDDTFYDMYPYLKLNIGNQPPLGAYKYRITLSKNKSYEYYEQFYLKVNYESLEADRDFYEDGGRYYIKINRPIYDVLETNSRIRLNSYIFQKGDRIRFKGYTPKSLPITEIINIQLGIYSYFTRWRRFTESYDYEISGVDHMSGDENYEKDDASTPEFILDDKGNKVRKTSSLLLVLDSIDEALLSKSFLICEIYRPRKESDNEKFFHIGEDRNILNPGESNRNHSGDTDQDYDSGTLAELNIYSGDIYFRQRYMGDVIGAYFPVESDSMSDFFESDVNDYGKFNISSEDVGEIRKKDTIIYGGKYFEGTKTNDLSKFDFNKEVILGNEHGAINKLNQSGYVLRVNQERKITSIYVGRESIINPDGTESLKILKDSLFGTIRPFNEDIGSNYPATYVSNGSYDYCYDGNNGYVIRIAYNGIIKISDYKYKTKIRQITDELKKSSVSEVYSVYDVKNDEYIIFFKYYEDADYNIDISSMRITNGSNIADQITFNDSNTFDNLLVGMVVDDSTYFPEYTYIEKIDKTNKQVYLSYSPTISGGGTTTISPTITKRFKLETVTFNESTNRWKHTYHYRPDCFGKINDLTISLKNGEVWLHEKLTDTQSAGYNYIYGIPIETIIKCVANMSPNDIKNYFGIVLYAKGNWNLNEKGDIYVINYDELGDMESRLSESSFTNNEGKYESDLLRDMNTPGYTNEIDALFNGRFLKGQAVRLTIRNDSNENVGLFSVILYITKSELSN